MKKSFFLVLLLANFFGYAQQYTLIPDVNFEKALISQGIDIGTIDGKVLTAKISTLTGLDVSNKNISDLNGIQDFVSLITLVCSDNKLTKIDVSKNSALTGLDCSNNQLTNINVNENINLERLSVINNQLINLDISKNNALIFLICFDNKLTNLDVTKNYSLEYLICYSNKIGGLDISKNINLKNLSCGINQLSSIDVTKNTSLTVMTCFKNKIISLDVTKNTALTYLDCSSNQMVNVDVSKNVFLEYLQCFNNPISSLDLSNNINLSILECQSNLLSSLNLKNKNNTKLKTINFTDNPNLTCIQVDNKSYSDTNWFNKKDAIASYSENCVTTTAIKPPQITATGNQTYCGTSLKIVESISIKNDPAEPDTDAIYIQISSGYVLGEDELELDNLTAHPTITTYWDPAAGKIKLYSPTGIKIPYTDFEAAIKDVVFSSSSSSPTGIRDFSITIGQANYLPSTGHYYQYVSNIGITWTSAKTAAEALNYYGLQGYLATLLSLEEAKISGEQAQGAGWIGGSDSVTEGEWRWVTGPEGLANGGTGIVFWNGTGNGSTPNFAYWNSPNNEPNNLGDEDYAHIKSNNVPGIPGSWNDLSNTGSSSGDYQPKGFIVEFGGMAGDPVLKISASTTMKMSQLTVTTPSPICFGEKITLQASAGLGTINWYDKPTGGVLLKTGTSFTTLPLTTDTTYYVDNGCTSRKPITVTVNTIPTITSTNTPISLCGSGAVTLQATATSGTINWYASETGSTVVATGTSFPIPNITANSTYYAEAFSNGCSNGNRVKVDVLVYTKPVVVDQEVPKCKSSNIELDAGVPGMFYSWSTGAKTQKISVLTSGTYSVVVTSPAPENCSSTKKIIVFEYDIPEIDRIDVNETTVVIYVKKEEPYFEYSVDGINYQNSNVFFNVQGGLQTAYVREPNSCSNINQPFIVLIIPKFFTPNGDTYNDYWEVKGLNNYPKAEVSIFDRYGKLISVLNATKANWDGMLNKNPLPSDDYWYVLRIDENSPEKRGHFSLKR